MSSDLKNSKKLTGSIYPEGAFDASSGLTRVEPYLTPKLLKSRFLFGIPLASPITKEKMTDAHLADFIERAANDFELATKTLVSPVMRRIRLPFDPQLYMQNIWLEVPHKPVQRVLKLYIASASYANTGQDNVQYPHGGEIYVIPNDWVDVSYAPQGRIFVNPINPAFNAIGFGSSIASAGATILQLIGQQMWIPAFWTIEAVVGFCSENGETPVIVNEAIGAKAALLLLSNLYPLHRVNSHSLGMDGMSQSVSDNFQTLLQARITQLEEQYKTSVNAIKTMTGSKIFCSNV